MQAILMLYVLPVVLFISTPPLLPSPLGSAWQNPVLRPKLLTAWAVAIHAELACHSSHLVPQSPVLISESLSLSFFLSLSYSPQFSPLIFLGLFQPLPGYLCVCVRVWL